ncbi:MAG TPA: LamG domain-containing protein [Spirochaetota bacterium]|nr:LamG domain-containing protein [Spirochaetota bacterium]
MKSKLSGILLFSELVLMAVVPVSYSQELEIIPGKQQPYQSDINTVLLDHFDGTTAARIRAYKNNGQPCGNPMPEIPPDYSYAPGLEGLNQALTMSLPEGMPAGSQTYLHYSGGQLLSQPEGTIEFFVYLSSRENSISVSQGPFFGSCAGWTMGMSIAASGRVEASAWAAFNMNSGSVIVPLNKWTHVAATWGSKGAKLYINGVQVGSDTNTGMPAYGYGGSVMISTNGTCGIDELRISNIARTDFNVSSKIADYGTFVGTVQKVSRGEILVGGRDIGSVVKMGDRLYLFAGDEMITLEAIFPMMTVVKCKVISGHKDKIKTGMQVYIKSKSK